MRFRYLIIIGILGLLSVVSNRAVYAQGATDFRFNEVLVHNTSNYVDDYGERNSWIEIVNSSYSNINIGGCYLTDDKNDLTKYWIPTDSPNTLINPRGFVVFFGTNHSSKSIYHLNFNITEGKTIYLVSGNGTDIIDQLVIPHIGNNITYARKDIDSNEWVKTDHPTYKSNNDHSRRASSGELFIQHDPSGLGMVVIAMIVVFSVLAILSIFYLLVGRIFTKKVTVKNAHSTEKGVEGEKNTNNKEVLSGEINAAIAATIHMYQNEIHDYESTILTVKRAAKPYSPWNSKLQLLRRNPSQK